MKATSNKSPILLVLLSASIMVHAATMCRYCGATVFGNCSQSPSGQHEHIVVSSLEALTPKIQQSKVRVEVGDEAIEYARGRNVDPAGLMRKDTGVDQYGLPTDPIKRAKLRERLNSEYESRQQGRHGVSGSSTSKQTVSLPIGISGTELKSFLGVTFGENVRQRKFKSFDDYLRETGKSPSDVRDYGTKKDLFTFKLNTPYRIYEEGMVKASMTGKIYYIGILHTFSDVGSNVKKLYTHLNEFSAIRKDLVENICAHGGVKLVEITKHNSSHQTLWTNLTSAGFGGVDEVLDARYFFFYDAAGQLSQIVSLGLMRIDAQKITLRLSAEDVALETQAEAEVSRNANMNPPVQHNYSADPYMAEKMRVKLNEEYEDECRRKGKRR